MVQLFKPTSTGINNEKFHYNIKDEEYKLIQSFNHQGFHKQEENLAKFLTKLILKLISSLL